MNKFLILLGSLILTVGCTDEDKLDVLYDDFEKGSFISEIDVNGDRVINKTDADNSNFSITYEANSVENGRDVNAIELYVAFVDNTVEEGAPNNSKERTLFKTINSSEFDLSGELPNFTIDFPANEILQTLGLTADETDGSDAFNFDYVIVTERGNFGTVSAQFDGQSADHSFSALVVCNLPIVPAGDWVVEMTDSFGDGWQTSTGNGGGGISVTLSNGDVIEVGLCTPYEANNFDCINDGSAGTATVTIPAGITSAVWNFPGDFYGEIGFTITSPSGNVVADYAPGGAAGPIPLNLCNE